MTNQSTDPVVTYYATPDGSVGQGGSDGIVNFVMPAGAVEITAEEYADAVAEWEKSKAAYVAELEAADRARQETDFDALTALGLPDATARRLSGLPAAPDE
ncbi:hypothetical protein [Nonomuraea turcica]|uniref:hypothetical protein n=1 Tax=Nonomuraea sp. G32 TaxID=3067274 RepID=UPI00273B28FF|nr:hypothetical protein [Nonomuraea sp. G32]MDP4501085.1 hypothetical protein [Nonomuraea sp. G32]